MKMSNVVFKATSGSLTCSDIVTILMDQPTGSTESHAHMHTLEGFRIKSNLFKKATYREKVKHWEGDSHLFPKSVHVPGRVVIDSSADLTDLDKNNPFCVFQDSDRLPPDRSYADRTGLNELPQVKETTYRVFKIVAKSKPLEETYDCKSALASLKVGKNPGDYRAKSSKDNSIRYIEVSKTVAPRVPASPAHSLFPDAESMVMHLTAALLSAAGKQVLRHLFMNITAGEQKTVGIFSKTAVRAVTAFDSSVPSFMFLRQLDVDTTKPRDSMTGRYPATGKVLITKMPIDHIVVVLGHRAKGELNVITCYPSCDTTADTIGTATKAYEDIAELTFGVHSKVHCMNYPALKW